MAFVIHVHRCGRRHDELASLNGTQERAHRVNFAWRNEDTARLVLHTARLRCPHYARPLDLRFR